MSSFFLNYKIDKREIQRLLLWFVQEYGGGRTTRFAETLKYVGFHYAMRAGISLGLDDLIIPPGKQALVHNAQRDVLATAVMCQRGEVTAPEKFRKTIDTWAWTSEHVKREVITNFRQQDPLNPVYMMAFSGARGNISQVRQLVGMRGLMADPQGNLIALPIQTNFREGLTIVDYIISCYGSRKGVVDTALRTATSGYLTRRLVEVAQETSIYTVSCGSRRGVPMTSLQTDNGSTLVPLESRSVGRVLARNVWRKGVQTHAPDLLATRNQDVTPLLARQLTSYLANLPLRSPLTCATRAHDVCQLCYGWGLQGATLVPLGEAVGVVAAQSIGEPGTQLTMRTFHTGGVFAGSVAEKVVSPAAGFVYLKRTPGRTLRTEAGDAVFVTDAPTQLAVVGSHIHLFDLPKRSMIFVQPGERVTRLRVLADVATEQAPHVPLHWATSAPNQQEGDDTLHVVSERSGQVFFQDLSLIRYADVPNYVAYEHGCIWVLSGDIFQTAAPFQRGDVIRRPVVQTSGQPRTEHEFEFRTEPNLFLGRANYSYALLNEPPQVPVGDFVRLGQPVASNMCTSIGGLLIQVQRGGRLANRWVVFLREVLPYAVGQTAGICVSHLQIVRAGHRLCSFPYEREKTGDIVQGLPKIEQLFEARAQKQGKRLQRSPKRTLFGYLFYFRARGLSLRHASTLSLLAVQCFLLHAIQRVYQEQGVNISDKHLEIIIREMATSVCIFRPGSTPFVPGELIDHAYIRMYNTVERVPAQYVPVLFGMSQLGLANDSFLSAASFQYTRKVLLASALHCRVDRLTTMKHAILVGDLLPLGPTNTYVRHHYLTYGPPARPRGPKKPKKASYKPLSP